MAARCLLIYERGLRDHLAILNSTDITCSYISMETVT